MFWWEVIHQPVLEHTRSRDALRNGLGKVRVGAPAFKNVALFDEARGEALERFKERLLGQYERVRTARQGQ